MNRRGLESYRWGWGLGLHAPKIGNEPGNSLSGWGLGRHALYYSFLYNNLYCTKNIEEGAWMDSVTRVTHVTRDSTSREWPWFTKCNLLPEGGV